MDDVRRRDLVRRYEAAMHAVQTGVALELKFSGEGGAGASPKHLRVGVNSALVNSAALGALLIAKGVITEEEYLVAIAEGVEREQAKYEKLLGVTLA